MTFSILARDAGTGEIGAAVATGTPVVGGFVLHALPGAGALATQGYSTNTLYGPRGLRLLEDGIPASEVCRRLTFEDEGRDWRQLIVIDAQGRTGGWTGEKNVTPMQHDCASDIAVAGNWLGSERVIPAMRAAYLAYCDEPMMLRLFAALEAGEAAGSDSRGAQSAAAAVIARDHPPLSLRVDLDTRPVARLREIYAATRDPDFQAFFGRLPRLSDPARR